METHVIYDDLLSRTYIQRIPHRLTNTLIHSYSTNCVWVVCNFTNKTNHMCHTYIFIGKRSRTKVFVASATTIYLIWNDLPLWAINKPDRNSNIAAHDQSLLSRNGRREFPAAAGFIDVSMNCLLVESGWTAGAVGQVWRRDGVTAWRRDVLTRVRYHMKTNMSKQSRFSSKSSRKLNFFPCSILIFDSSVQVDGQQNFAKKEAPDLYRDHDKCPRGDGENASMCPCTLIGIDVCHIGHAPRSVFESNPTGVWSTNGCKPVDQTSTVQEFLNRSDGHQSRSRRLWLTHHFVRDNNLDVVIYVSGEQ